MTNYKFIGWKATPEDAALIEAIREKTDETTNTAVLIKAVRAYARMHKVSVPA